MFQIEFQIADIIFHIETNLKKSEIDTLFFSPNPYSLYINYDISLNNGVDLNCETVSIYIIHHINKKIHSFIDDKTGDLFIYGDITELLNRNYNQQFSIFGNKGIVQKYIIHVLEERGYIVFHGCAVRNRKSQEVIMGLGNSGAGKSVFVASALRNNWELIATEQVIIKGRFEFLRGNVYDNISPLSADYFKRFIPKAKILEDKKLIEPLGQKLMVDLSYYAMCERCSYVPTECLTVVVLNIKEKDMHIQKIEDIDFFLRMLQISSSEKKCFPSIIGNQIIDIDFRESVDTCNHIIKNLCDTTVKKSFVGGGIDGFNDFFKKI